MKSLEIIGENYFGQWTDTRTACRGIVLRGEEILLSYETLTGQWMIPGGGLEEGEDEKECCIREISEETGMLVKLSECQLEIDEYYEDCKWVNRYFTCEVTGKTEMKLTRREREVGMEPRWISLEEAFRIFSEHQKYAETDEMRRGMYLREYRALSEILEGRQDGMNQEVKRDYENLMNFWNNAFAMTEEDRKEAAEGVDPEEDWKGMAPSEKLLQAACSLGNRKKVLDYGCGSGWAGIAAAKSGCQNVKCVDVAASGVEMARYYAELLKVAENIEFCTITTDWLSKEPDGIYDGFLCSNVLDVIPTEAMEGILREAARVTTSDAEVVIGLNYYMVPKENPEKNITVKYGNHVYINGILRLVTRTDEEWTEIFGKYFTVKKLDHFAWPGEETEKRRLFILGKK